jgi:hypothetical protein
VRYHLVITATAGPRASKPLPKAVALATFYLLSEAELLDAGVSVRVVTEQDWAAIQSQHRRSTS